MFDNHTILLFWPKQTFNILSLRDLFRALFTWSRRAKDHGLLYLNYPQINEVGKSDHMEVQCSACFYFNIQRQGFCIDLLFSSAAYSEQEAQN